MSRVVLLFVALVCLLALESCAAASVECDGDICTAPVLKIGVVGAGIGGASVAHFLRRGLPTADIHVFERDSAVGGRVRSTEIEGARIEQGASVYHISNRYFDSFVRDLNLKRKEPPNLGLWGIWNGAEFVIHESEWLLLTLTKMLYRYGLSPFKVENQAGLVKDRWVGVYSKLENTTFETSEALLESLNVSHFTQQSLLQALREGGVSEEYIHELVTAIERVNYGQDPAMNSFAGFVGLVGSGKDTLFSVEGGNHLVVEGLLKAARARIHLNTRVRAVTAVKNEGEDKTAYRLHYSRGGKELDDTFDAVVVATPLEFTDIEFTLGDEHVPAGELPAAAGKRRPYQHTHATLVVASELKRSFFGVPEGEWIPSFVLTTENSTIPFNSASAVRKLNETHNVYKVFSRQELADETLDRLFGGRGYTLRQPWAAYPVLTPYPFSEWPRIRLHDKLYYANAFESAVSCLETQIASAHNVANLLLGDLLRSA